MDTPALADRGVHLGHQSTDRVGAVQTPLIRPGLPLLLGVGMAGVLNAVFNLLLTRLAGPAVYSAGGPLLSLGTAASAASVGIEYSAAASIVRSGSFRQLGNQTKHLLFLGMCIFMLTPVISTVLHVSVLLSILALALFASALVAAIPIAMLLSRGLIWPLALLAIAEGIGRIVMFVPFAHTDPVVGSLSASIAVTVLGGAAMAAYALRYSQPATDTMTKADLHPSHQVAKSLLAFALYLPLVLPMWFARRLFLPESAGVLDMAAFLASGVAMLAGVATSIAVPRAAAGMSTEETHRRGLLCAGIALCTAVCVFAFAPPVLPILVASPMTGLRSAIWPFCIAGVGWAFAGYHAWIRVVQGDRPQRFIATAVLGIVAQALLAFTVGGSLGVFVGPIVALVVFAMAFLQPPFSDVVVDRVNTGWPHTVVPVSVGVMAYNEEGFIENSLLAFLTQESKLTRVDEIIVVVSGSTDGTESIAREIANHDPRVRLVVEPERRGKLFSVEHFLHDALHEICVVASADVTPNQDCLDQLVLPMIDDPSIGMTGPQVAPMPRPGFVASMHEVLWAVHNRVNTDSSVAKLGEIVAVRKYLTSIDPVAGCDEVLLEASVVAAGARLAYARGAIVHNTGPTSISEYIAHRRRIHVMHLVTRRQLGYCPATLPAHRGMKALFTEIVCRPTILPAAVGCILAEVSGRTIARWDVRRGEVAMTWTPSASSRQSTEAKLS